MLYEYFGGKNSYGRNQRDVYIIERPGTQFDV